MMNAQEEHFRDSIELDVAHLLGNIPATVDRYADEAMEELISGSGDSSEASNATVVSGEVGGTTDPGG